MAKARARVRVSGMVQGVFFRANTRSNALRLGVTGWVKNTAAGGVEAVFEGEEHTVREMVSWCREGPPGAHVTGVDVKYEPYRGEFRGFEIRY